MSAAPAKSALITPELKARFEKVVARYPKGQEQSAVIPLLHAMQAAAGGSLTQDHQQAVADFLNVPMSKVHEVTTFYTMYSLKPRGRTHISVCRTLPCALCGCEGVTKALGERLGVKPGEVTADGKFSYEEVECLNQCHLGPVLQIGDTVHGNLTPESVKALIDKLG
jgi:NADH-quinone oxidoreductase subunit E